MAWSSAEAMLYDWYAVMHCGIDHHWSSLIMIKVLMIIIDHWSSGRGEFHQDPRSVWAFVGPGEAQTVWFQLGLRWDSRQRVGVKQLSSLSGCQFESNNIQVETNQKLMKPHKFISLDPIQPIPSPWIVPEFSSEDLLISLHWFTQESAQVPPGGWFLRSLWWGSDCDDQKIPPLYIYIFTFGIVRSLINTQLKRVFN